MKQSRHWTAIFGFLCGIFIVIGKWFEKGMANKTKQNETKTQNFQSNLWLQLQQHLFATNQQWTPFPLVSGHLHQLHLARTKRLRMISNEMKTKSTLDIHIPSVAREIASDRALSEFWKRNVLNDITTLTNAEYFHVYYYYFYFFSYLSVCCVIFFNTFYFRGNFICVIFVCLEKHRFSYPKSFYCLFVRSFKFITCHYVLCSFLRLLTWLSKLLLSSERTRTHSIDAKYTILHIKQ